MAFNYHIPDRQPDLPTLPSEFYYLLNLATTNGLWLKACKTQAACKMEGGRYYLTKPNSRESLLSTDDLDEIRLYVQRHRTASLRTV